MLKKMKKIEKNRTKPRNPYYLVLFENRTKPGTVLSETILSGDSLYNLWGQSIYLILYQVCIVLEIYNFALVKNQRQTAIGIITEQYTAVSRFQIA